MPSPRSALRRAATVAIVAVTLTGLVAVPISAATATVTGTVTYLERVPLGPDAVAIVTIVDHTAAPEAGAVIGQQRIDAPAAVPLDFSVVVDTEAIDPTHAYGLYATIVDGNSAWDNRIGEPVITGGPTSGIALTLTAVSPTPPASIGGTITTPEGTELGPAAVSIAALIKLETGTLVSRQVRPIADPADRSFSIGFDPALVDPTATYVVKGGIIDGAAVWQNRVGATAITGGVAVTSISLPVERAATDLPVASPFPTPLPSESPAPSVSAAPTATPAPSVSAAPTATPAPTAPPTPTSAPTATATPEATPTPTTAPTAAPTPPPTPTPTAASGAPSPTPLGGPVTGTLTYREPYQLSGEAFAVVALVRGSARASESSIVASEVDDDISAKPVPFELALDGVTIDQSQTYTIQATIIDGENAWVTAQGIPVLTKGNPSTVDITLSYRPDLLKGAVSGQITAIGPQPSAGAYAMAVLVDPATGESLGIDVKTITDGLPVAFAIGYTITDIDPAGDYVVTAEVGEGDALWRNVAGIPVITDGNPTSGIELAVTAVAAPTPSASPAPSATPAPAPAPDAAGGSGLLPWIVLIAIVAAVAAFFVARNRNEAEGQPPEPPPSGPTGAPTEANTPTEADTPTSAESPTSAPGAPTEPPTEASMTPVTSEPPPGAGLPASDAPAADADTMTTR